MSALTLFLEQSWAQALAWTLLHFLWQGAVIGMAVFLLLRWTRLGASGRYLVGVAALVAMLAAPLVTLAVLAGSPEAAAPVAVPVAAREAIGAAAAVDVVPSGAAAEVAAPLLAPVVLAVWLAGVVLLTVRLLGGWVVARRLARRAVRPVSPEVHALARRVAGRLALDRFVRFLESTTVVVPVTVGWIKPVVLLPASALSGLTPEQIEALVAHELAHVRRHDYLVNLLQSVVETLLFYHPAVWWVSRVVRTEREHCCDDLAVGVCDRLVYVSALSDLASLRATPHLALAATDGPLVGRVRRLLGHPPDDGDAGSSWLPALLVLLVAAVAVPAVVAQSAGSARQSGPSPAGVVARAGQAAQADRAAAGAVSTGQVAGVSQGGVTGGVAVAGTSTDVSGGVRGQVAGAVSTSGVAGGVVASAGQSAGADQQAEEIRRLELEMAKAMKEMQARQAEIREEQLKLETANLQATFDVQRAEVEAQLSLARERLEEARRMVEAGSASRTQLLEAQSVLASLEQRMVQLASEQKREQAQLALRMREIREQASVEQVLRDLEMKLAQARSEMRDQVDAAVAAVDIAEAEREALRAARDQLAGARATNVIEAEREAMNRARNQAGRAYNVIRGDAMAESGAFVVIDPNEAVQENDVLVIEISGETMLPSTYVVQTNGRIRLPLLGELQVRGLTAAQVKDMLTDRLADRQLAEGASVTVTLRRPGER